MSDIPSSKRKKFKRQVEEEYPILKQDDFKTSIHNIADLPDYLERINQNILNIDKQISKKEMNTDKVKEFVRKNEGTKKKKESLTNLKDIVKQSVEGINDIFKSHQAQTPEPQPQPFPFKQHHYNSIQSDIEHAKVTSNKTLPSSIIKPNEKETIPIKKKSKKGVVSKEINEAKKSFKIDILKFNTNVCSNINDKDKKKSNQADNKNTHTLGNNNNENANNIASKKRINNNDSTPNKCVINQIIQPRKHSKSPAPKKNCFPFKPKKLKEANSEVSDEGESNISSKNIGLENDKKQLQTSLVKACLVAQKNKLISTTPNNTIKKNKTDSIENSAKAKKSTQPQPGSQMVTSLPKQQTKSPNYYTKGIPKEATIQDVLKLMLFFNEYVISQKSIKDYKKHHETLNNYSRLLSDLLNTNSMTESLEINKNNNSNSDKDSQKTVNAIKIQRQWQLYKFKQNLPQKATHTEAIKTMLVNNYIDKEGFGARKLIGMLNESLDSFVQMKSKNNKNI